MLGVFWGTRVGGGSSSSARRGLGSAGAGEVGPIVVKLDGARCLCGRRGCLEAYAEKQQRSARPPHAGTSAAKRRRSARAFRADDQNGPIGVVNDPARDAAQQHTCQPALPARAKDDRASVVFGAEVEDRVPDIPIRARD